MAYVLTFKEKGISMHQVFRFRYKEQAILKLRTYYNNLIWLSFRIYSDLLDKKKEPKIGKTIPFIIYLMGQVLRYHKTQKLAWKTPANWKIENVLLQETHYLSTCPEYKWQKPRICLALYRLPAIVSIRRTVLMSR